MSKKNTGDASTTRKGVGPERTDTSISGTANASPAYMPGNVKHGNIPMYEWVRIADPVAAPDQAWAVFEGSRAVAWAFERDQTGLGHGWCVRIGSAEKAGVAMTFEQAKLRAEMALDQMNMHAIVALMGVNAKVKDG